MCRAWCGRQRANRELSDGCERGTCMQYRRVKGKQVCTAFKRCSTLASQALLTTHMRTISSSRPRPNTRHVHRSSFFPAEGTQGKVQAAGHALSVRAAGHQAGGRAASSSATQNTSPAATGSPSPPSPPSSSSPPTPSPTSPPTSHAWASTAVALLSSKTQRQESRAISQREGHTPRGRQGTSSEGGHRLGRRGGPVGLAGWLRLGFIEALEGGRELAREPRPAP